MKINQLHKWNLKPKEAIELQRKLQSQISLQNSFKSIDEIKIIAGCDIALDKKSNKAFCTIIVYSFPDLQEIEIKNQIGELKFPYIPGLLSFREGETLLQTIELLENKPDLFIFDGHGIAHPRGIGIASHLGLFLNKPTIGCGKSKLFGEYTEPGFNKNDFSYLYNSNKNNESRPQTVIGTVLRTRDNVKPVFISPGHKIDHEMATNIISKCLDGYRIPKPTREADKLVGKFKLKYTS